MGRGDSGPKSRVPLSRERVLGVAVDFADESGIESLSMRKLAGRLGVEAMSLYNHVANKDDLLDGLVDDVVGEIGEVSRGADWKAALRQRALAARRVMRRHPWAPRLILSRTTLSPVMLRYLDSTLGILRSGGFSIELARRAMYALGSRILGFTQELFEEVGPEAVDGVLRTLSADEHPHIAELLDDGGHDPEVEFELGLDLILDGLERLRRAT